MSEQQRLGAPAALLLAALAFGAAAQGGFYRNALMVVVALACGAAFTAVRAGVRGIGIEETSLLAYGAWAILAGWAGGSVAAAVSTLAVCLVVAGVLICMRSIPSEERAVLARGIAGIGALVAASGLVGVALQLSPFALPSQGLWRAATSLTYANAAGCLLGMTALVAIAVYARSPQMRPALIAALNIAGLIATVSRGALLAFAAGLVVAALVARGQGIAGAAAKAGVVGAIAAAGVLPSMLESGPARPAWLAASLLAAAGTAWALQRAPAWVPGAAVAATAIAAIAAVVATPVGERLLEKRLTASSPVRIEEARAALRVVERRPLTGAGPGRAPLVWTDPSTDELLVAEFAHNEYLQALADTGVVGGVLVLWIVVAVVRAAARGRPYAPDACTRAAALGALTVLLVQAGVDFVWHVPVIPLTAVAIAGMCVPFSGPNEEETS